MDISIKSKSVGSWKSNAYCVSWQNEAILIDPGYDFELLDNFFSEDNSNYKSILLTHGHFDHIGAAEEFKKKYSIPLYIHSKDKYILGQANMIRRFAGESGYIMIPKIDYFLDTLNFIEIMGKKIYIHHLPGHSQGSVCFEIDNALFSGDIIFHDSIGRIDLPGGNSELLNTSLAYIFDRFENFQIYPGHGSPFILDKKLIHWFKQPL